MRNTLDNDILGGIYKPYKIRTLLIMTRQYLLLLLKLDKIPNNFKRRNQSQESIYNDASIKEWIIKLMHERHMKVMENQQLQNRL